MKNLLKTFGMVVMMAGLIVLFLFGVSSCMQYDMNRWAYNAGKADKENHHNPWNLYTNPGQREAYWRGYEDGTPDPRIKS